MNFLVTVKKNLMKRGKKKMLNAKCKIRAPHGKISYTSRGPCVLRMIIFLGWSH